MKMRVNFMMLLMRKNVSGFFYLCFVIIDWFLSRFMFGVFCFHDEVMIVRC